MKKSKTSTAKLPESNTLPPHFVEFYLRREENLAKAKTELEKINEIRSYEGRDWGSGIGYLNMGATGQRLVEYSYDHEGLDVRDITLAESAIWWEKTMWAEQRLGSEMASYEESAVALWLRHVAAEL